MSDPTPHADLIATLKHAAATIEAAVENPMMNDDTAVEMELGLLGQTIAKHYPEGGLRHLLRFTGDHHDWNRSLDPLRYVLSDEQQAAARDAVRSTSPAEV